jgi:hypothetical protein
MTNTVKTGRISALISQKSEIFASFPQGKPFAPLCGARWPQGRRIMNRVNNNLSQQKGEPWRIRHGSYKEEENEETNDQTS